MKLSLSSFLYLNYPLEEAFKRIAAAGYEGVDIWGGRPHAYRNDLSPHEIRRLRDISERLGVEFASFIPAQFRYPTCLCSPSETIRQDSVAYIKDSLRTAAAFGAPIVSVCPGHTIFGQTSEDGWRRLCQSLDEICSAADSVRLKVALEPADRYETDLVNNCEQAIQLLEDVRWDNLGVVLDNGHSHVVGESAEKMVARLGDRLFHVHVDDNLGQRDQHLIPGNGTFDFVPFIAALRETGYNGFLTAELSWDYTLEPDDPARATRTRMKEYLRRVRRVTEPRTAL
ncbi:MAG: sugar phosphate isomerase/epimerase [Acidobacteria bacterium]|nr:MAG: sugar phosphate isomerase/epimerase [Acidobacteriota bacterium]